MIGVNFLWHMHQPDYRQAGGGPAILPWVRLHAVRGYLDLATVLAEHPSAHCVVNFSGILLEQLLTYSPQQRDQFADLSLRDPADLSADEVRFVLDHFFSANVETLIRPQARYWELYQQREAGAGDFSVQELRDIQVWFNLAWIGFTGRRRDDVQQLIAKGAGYSADDQRLVLAIHDELLAQVLPLHRSLAESGAIELSFTPHHHPILPLLHDLGEGTHGEGDPLPEFSWPGDAAAQVARGIQWYEHAFGQRPLGAWPAEGSVSNAALATLADASVRWAATDQQNMPQPDALAHLKPWRWSRDGHEVLMFFRDTRIADKIGFDYARWDATEAARDLVGNIYALGSQAAHDRPVVSIILDGENPWEAYPDGGEGFLHELFTQLEAHRELECVTPEMLLDKQWPQLDHIHAGSWIGGNFDIWTRDAEARQAWRLLARARQELEGAGPRARPDDDASTAGGAQGRPPSSPYDHLLAAEGSDWFWWYGDTFNSDQKPQFDALFRGHLIRAYELAGIDVPEEMYTPILSAQAPVKQLSTPIIAAPTIDGRQTDYFEWRGAARVTASAGQGAMATTTASGIGALDYGFSELGLCLRLELCEELMQQLQLSEPRLRICLSQDSQTHCLNVSLSPGKRRGKRTLVAVRYCIELTVDLAKLNIHQGTMALSLELFTAEQPLRFPATGAIALQLPNPECSLREWIV